MWFTQIINVIEFKTKYYGYRQSTKHEFAEHKQFITANKFNTK